MFNNTKVQQTTFQKHLGIYLDENLSFNYHLKTKINTANKGIGIIKRLSPYLPRSSLLTIYKSFVRPHLDYGDVIYDQPNNESFSHKIESVQYNAALAITGAIRGTSREKLYKELGLESLRSRRKFRRLCVFFKIQSTQTPPYLLDLIPKHPTRYNIRRSEASIAPLFCRKDFHKNSFFPATISDWNNLKPKVRRSDSYNAFRNGLLKEIRPMPNKVFGINDVLGLKYLTRLRLGLSHLHENKFRHNFQDTINPLCSCSLDEETVSHFFLRCHHFNNIRATLLNEVSTLLENFLDLSEDDKLSILLYGHDNYDNQTNMKILSSSIKYILNSKRFDEALF